MFYLLGKRGEKPIHAVATLQFDTASELGIQADTLDRAFEAHELEKESLL